MEKENSLPIINTQVHIVIYRQCYNIPTYKKTHTHTQQQRTKTNKQKKQYKKRRRVKTHKEYPKIIIFIKRTWSTGLFSSSTLYFNSIIRRPHNQDKLFAPSSGLITEN